MLSEFGGGEGERRGIIRRKVGREDKRKYRETDMKRKDMMMSEGQGGRQREAIPLFI